MTLKEGASVSNDEKLKVYALFKQATVGECSEHGGGQPWAVQVEKRAKWDAWAAVAGACCRPHLDRERERERESGTERERERDGRC